MIDHTPTPWKLAGTPHNMIVCDADGGSIADCSSPGPWMRDKEALSNAAFIVKAVNSHDALVKALKNARNCIDTLIVNSPDKKKRRNLGEFIREIDGSLASIKERT